MLMVTNRNAVSFQIGTIPLRAGQDTLNSGNRVSVPAPNDTIAWVTFVSDTYIRKFANATEAAAVDVSGTDGATKGTLFPAGTVTPMAFNRGEVVKIDTAGEVEYNFM